MVYDYTQYPAHVYGSASTKTSGIQYARVQQHGGVKW